MEPLPEEFIGFEGPPFMLVTHRLVPSNASMSTLLMEGSSNSVIVPVAMLIC